MKHLIILIISFLPFITAGQFIIEMGKLPLEKQRKNEIILTSVSGKYYLNTYFKEDQKVKLGSSDPTTVDEFYLKPIELIKTADGITATYRGPLYAQCGGSGYEHCAIQGYSIQLDSCGELLRINEDKTDLKNYQPGVVGKHVSISKHELGRLASYSNSPTILDRLYTDIAGPDLESRYILGNSLVRGKIVLRTDYSSAARTRWGLNPWGTNTAATFFIHLSIIRKAIQQLFLDRSGCGKPWPEFLGRTPLNLEAPDSAMWNPVFRDYQSALKDLNANFGDLRNRITESLIQNELFCNSSQPNGVTNTADIQSRFENMIKPLVQAQYLSKEESDLLYRHFVGSSSLDQTFLSGDLRIGMAELEKAKYFGQLVELTQPHPPLSETEKISAFHIYFKAYSYFTYRVGVWENIEQKGLKYFEQLLQNPPDSERATIRDIKERWDLIVQAAP